MDVVWRETKNSLLLSFIQAGQLAKKINFYSLTIYDKKWHWVILRIQ